MADLELLRAVNTAAASAADAGRCAAGSLLLAGDCAELVQLCVVLPSTLVALDPSQRTGVNNTEQILSAVEALDSALQCMRAAVEELQPHDSMGVIGILFEAPHVWLGFYRALRGLAAQLGCLLSVIRAAGKKHQSMTEDLQVSVRSLGAVCQRSKEAAQLFGQEVLEYAQSAAGGSCCEQQEAEADMLTAASGCTMPPSPGAASSSRRQQHAVLAWLAPLRPAAAAPTAPGEPSVSVGVHSDPRVAALVTRIQDLFLFDSEMDQLDQDEAFLANRIAILNSNLLVSPHKDAACGAATQQQLDLPAQLLQARLLLAAVRARARALHAQEAAERLQGDGGSAHTTGSCGRSSASQSFACQSSGVEAGKLGKVQVVLQARFDEDACEGGCQPRRMLFGCLPWVHAA